MNTINHINNIRELVYSKEKLESEFVKKYFQENFKDKESENEFLKIFGRIIDVFEHIPIWTMKWISGSHGILTDYFECSICKTIIQTSDDCFDHDDLPPYCPKCNTLKNLHNYPHKIIEVDSESAKFIRKRVRLDYLYDNFYLYKLWINTKAKLFWWNYRYNIFYWKNQFIRIVYSPDDYFDQHPSHKSSFQNKERISVYEI